MRGGQSRPRPDRVRPKWGGTRCRRKSLPYSWREKKKFVAKHVPRVSVAVRLGYKETRRRIHPEVERAGGFWVTADQ